MDDEEYARELFRVLTRPADESADPFGPLPRPEEQWALLLEHLSYEGAVRQVAPGRIAVRRSDEDETFLVFWRGDLHGSTREKLPPVRGTAVQRRLQAAVVEARAKDPDATFGWSARRPGTGEAQGPE